MNREQETVNREILQSKILTNPPTLQPSKPLFGFLNIYKPVGMTSHDVVAILRKITKIKQIGHTGTLDPFAQGVLPIAIGKATRLIEFLDDDKEYLAEVSFGKSTNTYDTEGSVTAQFDCAVTEPQIQEALKSFEGEIEQIPPIFSAIKVKGKKLYEYARKGEQVEIEPRKVFIEKIEMKSFDFESQKAEVLIKCSKGTYIRSIAHDMGQNLGCGAHLSKLVRTQAGNFCIKNSVQLENITLEDIEKNLIDPISILPQPQIIITQEEQQKIGFGQTIVNGKNFKENQNLILVYNEKVSAIAQIVENRIKAKKVFNL